MNRALELRIRECESDLERRLVAQAEAHARCGVAVNESEIRKLQREIERLHGCLRQLMTLVGQLRAEANANSQPVACKPMSVARRTRRNSHARSKGV